MSGPAKRHGSVSTAASEEIVETLWGPVHADSGLRLVLDDQLDYYFRQDDVPLLTLWVEKERLRCPNPSPSESDKSQKAGAVRVGEK